MQSNLLKKSEEYSEVGFMENSNPHTGPLIIKVHHESISIYYQ